MKLKQSAEELAKLAESNDTMSFVFDVAQEGRVRIDWQGCLTINVTPRDLPRVINAMRYLDDLGISVI